MLARTPGSGKNCSLQTNACMTKIPTRAPMLTLRTRPREHTRKVYQHNLTSVEPPNKQRLAKNYICSSAEKETETRGKPCSTPRQTGIQKQVKYDREWKIVTTKKPKHRIGKINSATLQPCHINSIVAYSSAGKFYLLYYL